MLGRERSERGNGVRAIWIDDTQGRLDEMQNMYLESTTALPIGRSKNREKGHTGSKTLAPGFPCVSFHCLLPHRANIVVRISDTHDFGC